MKSILHTKNKMLIPHELSWVKSILLMKRSVSTWVSLWSQNISLTTLPPAWFRLVSPGFALILPVKAYFVDDLGDDQK
jgi:hypothetical protein